MTVIATAACACGNVEFHARGAPIVSAACYCDDCHAGSRQIEALPNAAPALDADGGSEYILYRKDRVTCTKGSSLLKNYKIRADSKTNRVVASCCNSAMMLSFEDSRHWVTMFRKRFSGELPPLEMRICTKFKPENVELPNDLPNYKVFSFKLVGRLLAARIAMLLGR